MPGFPGLGLRGRVAPGPGRSRAGVPMGTGLRQGSWRRDNPRLGGSGPGGPGSGAR